MWIKSQNYRALGDVSSVSRTKTTFADIPEGPAGTAATLAAMRDLAMQAVKDPAQTIREKALAITQNLSPRDWLAQAKALQAYVRDNVRYTRDPVDFELVSTPQKTLQYMQGDCDDQATLLAAMLTSIGHPTRFVAIGMNGGPFSHVMCETLIGEQWVPCETIINKPFGWYPANVTSRYIRKV